MVRLSLLPLGGWGGFPPFEKAWLGFLLLLLISCNDDDSFTTSPLNYLFIPVDTVKMDTVFAKIPVAAQTFWIYNNSGDGIRCSNIRQEKGNQSGFRVNVDGTYLGEKSGYQTNGIEVRRGDSIRVFVEFTSPDNGSALYKQIDDKLIFRLESGVEQVVNLRACAWNADVVRNLEVKKDTTIDTTISGKALVVYGDITVDSLATLTIAPGTTIFFHDDGGINVKGKLLCKGTAEKNITLRGDRLDNMFDYLPYDGLSGRWKGIHFASNSYDNVIEYTDIHSGSDAIVCDSSDVTRRKLTVNASTIHNCKGYGLLLNNSNVRVTNTQVTNTQESCIAVYGGELSLIHNTIAQFYSVGNSTGVAFTFANCIDNHLWPLKNLEVKNCIITGYADDVVMLEKSDSVALNFHFYNSILRTPEVNDTAYVKYFDNIIWEDVKDTVSFGRKNFVKIDYNLHQFDFHLDSLSKANGAANAQWMLPLNRDGLPRDEKKLNMGCY